MIYFIFNASYSKEVVLRITRCEYTCQAAGWTFLHGGNKSFQCERTVVYRESSRSGRWSSKATRDLRAGTNCRCCRVSSLSPSHSFFAPRARLLPRLIYSFLRRCGSLSFSTSSLFLSFCPFSASANDSRLFIPRLCIAPGTERGCFCVYSATAEFVVVLSSLLPPIPSFDSRLLSSFECWFYNAYVTWIMSLSRCLINHISCPTSLNILH